MNNDINVKENVCVTLSSDERRRQITFSRVTFLLVRL